jgi:DNA-binding FadR family transcriptional regulator
LGAASVEHPSAAGSDLVRNAVGAITEHIRKHELGPGDRLPSEAAFSVALGVSRTVIREAFRSLAALRLIDLHTGKRSTIAPLDYGAIAPLIEHGILTEQITVRQIYDVRRTIETRTAALAALHRSEEEASSIGSHAQAMSASVNEPDEIMEHDLALHRDIARASKNPVFALLIGAFEGVTRRTWPIGWRSFKSASERSEMAAIHVQLANAVIAGDPLAASEAVEKHFDFSVRALFDAGIA